MSDEPVPEYVPLPLELPPVFNPEDVPQGPTIALPDTLNILDIENERSVLVQREANMKDVLTNTFLNVNTLSLKPVLLSWAMAGYPSLYPILSVQVDIPSVCSDGVVRDIQPYLEYCFGMPLSTVVDSISAKLVGILVSYVYTRTSFSICVTRS